MEIYEAGPGFSGHETFPFRYGWLKKGVDALKARPDIFRADDATTYLGVGKNMVSSIRHWCLACGLFEEINVPGSREKLLKVSWLGEFLMGSAEAYDPYLEDPSSLWLLHFKLTASPGRAYTWYWLFNELRKREFTRADLRQEVLSLVQSVPSARASAGTVKRDVDCFVRTYVSSRIRKNSIPEDTLDCPLVELNLLTELADNETLAFDTGERTTLSDEVFLFCLMEFWNRTQPNQNTCTFEALAYSAGGPGKLFRMSDSELVTRAERIEASSSGAIAYDETAGLKQLYRRHDETRHYLLDKVYSRRPQEVPA